MTAASNSEARKRASEAASNSESAPLATNGSNRGDDTSEAANGPQNATRRPAPVDSGAIGRLNERRTVVALLACLPMHEDGTGHVADCGFDLDAMSTCGCASLPGRLAAIVREHTDRALAEVEQRLAKAWDEGYEKALWAIDRGMTPYEGMANPYRAARQEQGR